MATGEGLKMELEQREGTCQILVALMASLDPVAPEARIPLDFSRDSSLSFA